jgi:hypothetical protein
MLDASSAWQELLLLAHFGKKGKPEAMISRISQETLGRSGGHNAVTSQLGQSLDR